MRPTLRADACAVSLNERSSQRAVREHDEPRQRPVVGVHERERPAVGRLAADLADHAAVHDRGDASRPGPAARRSPRSRRARAAASDSIVSAPGITSQRSSATRLQRDRVALGHADAELAALPLAEETSRSSGTTTGSRPVRARERRRGLRVRRSGVTNRPAERARPRAARPPRSACASPSGASGGSPWPSSSGNGSPGTAGADAPWRTSTISVAPGGSANARWW